MPGELEAAMGAVAKWSVARRFTLAEGHGGLLGDLELFRLEASSLVGAVAERGVTGAPA